MRKLVTILKYTFILILILLFVSNKPNQTQLFHSVRFTDDVFASQSEDKSENKQVYNLDIKDLEKVQGHATKDGDDIKGFPIDILRLHGKKVKLTGYLLIPYDAYLAGNSLDNFGLGKNAYGCPCCNWGSSPLPTIFNVVFVTMKDGQKLKPPFTPLIEVTGTFYAHQEYYTDENGKKKLSGLFFIEGAEAKKKGKLIKGVSAGTADEAFNNGIEYGSQGKDDEAIAEFSKAIKINPNDAEAYNNRGVAYKHKGNLEQAILDYNKAIEIDSNFTKAYNNRGNAYLMKGNYDQAISDYSKAIEVNPYYTSDDKAYYSRSVAYFNKGEYEKAWADVHKAEELGFKADPDFLEQLKKASGRDK
jgi:tetratricopeptide (TPR) repeat protein